MLLCYGYTILETREVFTVHSAEQYTISDISALQQADHSTTITVILRFVNILVCLHVVHRTLTDHWHWQGSAANVTVE